MPIRPDLRHFYAGQVWAAIRACILERAGGKFDSKGKYLGCARCEQCGVPDRQRVERATEGSWRSMLANRWRSCRGKAIPAIEVMPPLRTVLIVLTIAHLDHDPGHNTDENLKALCQYCHLHHDAGHHAETRATRKDRARPLLGAAAEGKRWATSVQASWWE